MIPRTWYVCCLIIVCLFISSYLIHSHTLNGKKEKSLCEPFHQVTGHIHYSPDSQFNTDEIDDGFRQEYRAWLLLHTGYNVWAASTSSSGECYTSWNRITQQPFDPHPCGTHYGWSATRERDPVATVKSWTPFRDDEQLSRLKNSPPFPTMLIWLHEVGLQAILQCNINDSH